jgi:hypothetical protein
MLFKISEKDSFEKNVKPNSVIIEVKTKWIKITSIIYDTFAIFSVWDLSDHNLNSQENGWKFLW